MQDVRRELGCEYLLEGSMHIADDQMSLDVTLTDTKQSRRLWTRIFSEPLSRVINMETRLVTQLAGALEMAAGLDNIDRGTTNSEAYIAYLEGTPVVSDDARSLFKSIECLKRATRLDPRFGEAFVSLASSYYFAADRLNRPELVQQAFEHYRRAIDVGGLTIGNKAWAVWTTCTPRIAGVYEWDRAETALREAMSQRDAYERWFSDPIEPVRAPLERGYAIILSAAGLFAEAAAFAEIEDDRVRIFHSRDGRDPQGISQRWVPLQYANAREWQKAGAYLDEDLRRRPEQIEILVRRAEWYLIPTGRLQEARESLDTFDVSTTAMQRLLGEQATADDARRAIVGVSAPARIRLAFAEGDVATASDLIKRHGRGDLLGLIGDIEGMVHYFEQHPRGAQLVRAALLGATNADELCQHPRYVALLERFKLDEPWQRELSRRVELLAPITGVRATTLRDQVSSAS